MIEISDTIFSRSIFVRAKEIYPLSLDILDNVAMLGNIIENRHEFESTGPRKRVHLFFDVEDNIDEHSSIIFSFIINGESNGDGYLDIDIKGTVSMKLPQRKAFGSEAFNYFYTNKFFPVIRRDMEKKIKNTGIFIEKKIEKLNFKYA